MSYTKHTWVNGTAPAINATHLNEMEEGIYNAQSTADNAATAASTAQSTASSAATAAGTAQSTADNAATAASAAQSTADAAQTTANAKYSKPSSGIPTSDLAIPSDYSTSAVRKIYAGTNDMTAGSTGLTTGVIYCVYEA